MSTQRHRGWSRARFERSLLTARGGSFSALGQLLEHYRGYLLWVSHEELRNDLAAKVAPSDVVQETFLQASRGFATFKGRTEAEFRAWLRKILLNNLHDAGRRYGAQMRQASREVSLDSSGAFAARNVECRQPRASSVALSAEKRQAVERALASLPADYRRAIELRSFDERSFEEVGRALDRSSEAARKLWSRAIERLSELLAEQERDD